MELIDMNLPLYAINYVASKLLIPFLTAEARLTYVIGATDLVVKAIILLVFAKYLGVALPVVVAIVYVTQNFYLRTSRQIRLLDIEAKAPLYNHFIETVAGSSTIRAMGTVWQDAFQQEAYARIDFSQRPFYLLLCIQQCLALVLDLTVAMLAVLVVAIMVTWRDSFREGDVGVALSMLITFSSTLMSVVKFWTLMEMSVGAVARVRDFVAETDSEEPGVHGANGQDASRPSLPPPADWPRAGAINFEGVIAAYS
jgi:ATP-binding cassette subfamily C (CFTR/MRP) protein 1